MASLTFLEEVARNAMHQHRDGQSTSSLLDILQGVIGELVDHQDASDAFKAIGRVMVIALGDAKERVEGLENTHDTALRSLQELIERLQEIGGPR